MNDKKRQLLWHGMLLFLLGLLVGLVEQKFTNTRMGLAAHLEGVMNGTFLIALGAIWTEVSQLHTLDQCLLQTAGDSNGDPANFTNGPEQKAVIPDYSGGFPVIVPLNNTLGVFQNNLRSSGVPLPP